MPGGIAPWRLCADRASISGSGHIVLSRDEGQTQPGWPVQLRTAHYLWLVPSPERGICWYTCRVARDPPGSVVRVQAQQSFGEWLSLVEHLVRDQGVGGSNPLSPTNLSSLTSSFHSVVSRCVVPVVVRTVAALCRLTHVEGRSVDGLNARQRWIVYARRHEG